MCTYTCTHTTRLTTTHICVITHSLTNTHARTHTHTHVYTLRSPSIVIAYLMKKRGWRLAECYKWVKDKREKVDIKPGKRGMCVCVRLCVCVCVCLCVCVCASG